ncbi:MAG TPA: DUF3570 domain-containing protein [Gammaproteobacteria bacterium]|nr:DUF3570 domain-containing protein [Gammaproteobacteria bacterium]
MEVAVAATDLRRHALAVLCALPLAAWSAVLPEDRADALYHSYDGGGVQVTGPSILVRKGDAKRFSLSANYYVDSISSASIDVITQGSEYNEQRTQYSVGLDYLHADTTLSLGYTNSDESDYKADTWSISLSQTFFGNMTTLTLGYSRGFDDVLRNRDDNFAETAEHQNYHVSLTQVLTKDLLLSLNYDAVADQGYLNNPYRSVVFFEPSNPSGLGTQPEQYPNTRASNAISANLLYYLPWRATLKAGYRYYADDWDIEAHTLDLGYVHTLGSHWIMEAGFRYYQQTEADFYADIFPRVDAQNFLARDKELSNFDDYTLSLGLSYEIRGDFRGLFDKASLNFKYSRIEFSYSNFSDLSDPARPDYSFTADVIQAYVSAWY